MRSAPHGGGRVDVHAGNVDGAGGGVEGGGVVVDVGVAGPRGHAQGRAIIATPAQGMLHARATKVAGPLTPRPPKARVLPAVCEAVVAGQRGCWLRRSLRGGPDPRGRVPARIAVMRGRMRPRHPVAREGVALAPQAHDGPGVQGGDGVPEIGGGKALLGLLELLLLLLMPAQGVLRGVLHATHASAHRLPRGKGLPVPGKGGGVRVGEHGKLPSAFPPPEGRGAAPTTRMPSLHCQPAYSAPYLLGCASPGAGNPFTWAEGSFPSAWRICR
jgi:hypothetical protein